MAAIISHVLSYFKLSRLCCMLETWSLLHGVCFKRKACNKCLFKKLSAIFFCQEFGKSTEKVPCYRCLLAFFRTNLTSKASLSAPLINQVAT